MTKSFTALVPPRSFFSRFFFATDEKKLCSLRRRAQGIKEARNIELGKIERSLALDVQALQISASAEKFTANQYWSGELNKTTAEIEALEKRMAG